MKWSVNVEWGTTSLTAGMWQPMQPAVGFTGQMVRLAVSARLVFRCRGGDTAGAILAGMTRQALRFIIIH